MGIVSRLARRRQRVRELEQALEMMLVAFRAHDRWCGHNADAPGDGVFNRAVRMAEKALDNG